MKIRSKLIVPFVAIAMLLGMTAGVMAQSTDTQPVSVDLTGNSTCGIEIGVVQGDFGTWEWNGTTYVKTSTSSTMVLTAGLSTIPPGGCDVHIAFTGLSGDGGDIAPTRFSAVLIGPGGTVTGLNPAGWNEQGVEASGLNFSYDLLGVPDTLPFGTYEGEFTASVANAA